MRSASSITSRRWRSFSDFERAQDLPLQLGLILDTSDSVKRVLPEEKAAAVNFLQQIMRPQSDTAFVMGFGGDIKLWQDSTANRQELIDAIARLKQPGWGTRFFDALYSACRRPARSHGRRQAGAPCHCGAYRR